MKVNKIEDRPYILSYYNITIKNVDTRSVSCFWQNITQIKNIHENYQNPTNGQ